MGDGTENGKRICGKDVEVSPKDCYKDCAVGCVQVYIFLENAKNDEDMRPCGRNNNMGSNADWKNYE